MSTDRASARRERTRSDIAGAALRLIDAEGFDALSMRRVAGELGMGTMTLYSYFASRDELLRQLADQIGEELLLDEVPGDWKQALTAIARKSRATLLRHPWVFAIDWEDEGISPSFVRHMDQSLQAVAPLGVDAATQMAILRTVDDYTMGNAMDEHRERRQNGASDSFPREEVMAVAREHGLEHVAGILDELDPSASEAHFEQGLAWLLAGIEVSLAR